jgi:peptide-methionine (S)-S-oxide reductase
MKSIALIGLLFCSITLPAEGGQKVHLEKATFGAGCFWCVEAVFERLDGVQSVVAGYAGGTKANPTYEEVCTGTTGHAEVAQITFDPAKVSYEKLLDLFWKAHDPTTLNRQGADVGTQYRSVIFYHDERQRLAAEKSKAEAAKHFSEPIVTEIKPLDKFYEAENYHQDYFRNHPDAPYCRFVIKPKLEKLQSK